jgi:hypothetical protein
MSRARQELQAEESMSDVAMAFQKTAEKFEREREVALDVLQRFSFEQERRDELNGGDLIMTELRLQAQNILRQCGRTA